MQKMAARSGLGGGASSSIANDRSLLALSQKRQMSSRGPSRKPTSQDDVARFRKVVRTRHNLLLAAASMQEYTEFPPDNAEELKKGAVQTVPGNHDDRQPGNSVFSRSYKIKALDTKKISDQSGRWPIADDTPGSNRARGSSHDEQSRKNVY